MSESPPMNDQSDQEWPKPTESTKECLMTNTNLMFTPRYLTTEWRSRAWLLLWAPFWRNFRIYLNRFSSTDKQRKKEEASAIRNLPPSITKSTVEGNDYKLMNWSSDKKTFSIDKHKTYQLQYVSFYVFGPGYTFFTTSEGSIFVCYSGFEQTNKTSRA